MPYPPTAQRRERLETAAPGHAWLYHSGLLRYLSAIGLADAAALRSSEVRITDLSRSHSVRSVRLGGGRHLIVKRARPRPGERQGTLGAELVAYGLAARYPALRAVMPECLWTDPWLQVLVTEAVEPGETLHAHHYHDRVSPEAEQARRLGAALARWQQDTRGLTELPKSEPWILGILTPGRWRPAVADRLLVHGPIRSELRRHFSSLTAALELSCLSHGDLKWDNCLIAGSTPGVKVIDWETAGVGDPAWDVAGILQDHLAYNLAAGPGADPSQLRASLEAFLAAYLEIARPADKAAFVGRAARLAGARLVQTALEQAAVSSDERLPRVLLESGLALLRDPQVLHGEKNVL